MNESTRIRSSNVPWQFDWMNPVRQTVNTDNIKANNKQHQFGNITSHSAAIVTSDEIIEFSSFEADDLVVDDFNNEDNQNLDSADDVSFIVTATLIQSSIGIVENLESKAKQPDNHQHDSNRPDVADTLLLEIIENRKIHTTNTTINDSSRSQSRVLELGTNSLKNITKENDLSTNGLDMTCRCLQSRLLRWPESTLDSSSVDSSELTKFWQGLFPIQNGQDQVTRSTKGLIAATWIRLPPSFTRDMDDPADALDVLQLLSLFGKDQPEQQQSQLKKHDHVVESNDEYEQQNESTNDNSNILELRLVCLTNDGNLHFYSPWNLFQKVKQVPVDQSNNNDLTNSLASLFLGQSLLATIDDNLLPMSQSMNSIRLKIPFMKKLSLNQRSSEMKKSKTNIKPKYEKKKSLSVWDSSVWDPVVDTKTRHNQTKHNVLTHCVAAFDYVVVGGYGKRRWKTSSGYDSFMNIETKMSSKGDNHVNEDANEGTSADSQNTSHDESSIIFSQENYGGFISFNSLYHFTETRIVYIPFVPEHISPFRWMGAFFVLVTGRIGQELRAAAIRVDSSVHSVKAIDALPRLPNDGKYFSSDVISMIHRFQVVPIDTTGAETAINIFGCDSITSRPSIVFLSKTNETGRLSVNHRFLSKIEYFSVHDILASYSEYVGISSKEHLPIISLKEFPGHNTILPTDASQVIDGSNLNVWCHVGQGWCLIGLDSTLFFVCFEGGSSKRDAFVIVLSDDHNGNSSSSKFSHIAPLDPFDILHRLKMELFEENVTPSRASSFVDASTTQRNLDTSVETISEELLSAIETISNVDFRDSGFVHSTSRSSKDLTHRERYEGLLRHCKTWTDLRNQSMCTDVVDFQMPYISVRFNAVLDSQSFVSLRKAMINNGSAAPFSQILSWLLIREEYFIASSIALDLLREAESLVNLWKYCNKIYDDDEVSILEGILDGIAPIQNDVVTRTKLADMAIACLLKGGFSMASTLDIFLCRNFEYDPACACLMLGAIVTCALSEEDDLVAGAMGSDYEADDAHIENIMWPVRCLLRVGVNRDCLTSALLLLNSSVPDELRRHQRNGHISTTGASLEKCKHLVSLIVQSAPDAAGLLLDLIDENHDSRFWTSLHHDTQLELSLISIADKVPLLREPEVRSWAIMQLQSCIASETVTGSNSFDILPSYWLMELVVASLKNAGCTISNILEIDECDEDKLNENTLDIYEFQVKSLKTALVPASGHGGLDYDLLIPSLLMLQYRDFHWHPNAKISTRSILNVCCQIAGRPELEEPMFVMTSSTLLRHCTVLNDIRAGAKLIGGKNGLILECCYILIEVLGMNINDAEEFLLKEPMSAEKLGFRILERGPFELQAWHCRILLLLMEHVLRIRTYGEFETRNMRGRIDPVFAASICFKTWWAITRQHVQVATQWLSQWLKKKLSMDDDGIKMSPHRLACAALVRALIWPGSKHDTDSILMAKQLEMDAKFLIHLSQPCCGLMESIPYYIAEDMNGSIRMPTTKKAK